MSDVVKYIAKNIVKCCICCQIKLLSILLFTTPMLSDEE